MFRLTREVRFAINDPASPAAPVCNGHGGCPSIAGFGRFFACQITLAGELQPHSSYLRNIKEIDRVVRDQAIPLISDWVRRGTPPVQAPGALLDRLGSAWAGVELAELRLQLSPYLSVSVVSQEHPMVRLSHRYEFSASHRLHNAALSDEENRRTFGKCNNPHGHGHNYELQVTLGGDPDSNGLLIDIPALDQLVHAAVIDRFDHKNLNLEVDEFRQLIPSVENIALVIHRILKPLIAARSAVLRSVTVWETPRTWCEYSE